MSPLNQACQAPLCLSTHNEQSANPTTGTGKAGKAGQDSAQPDWRDPVRNNEQNEQYEDETAASRKTQDEPRLELMFRPMPT